MLVAFDHVMRPTTDGVPKECQELEQEGDGVRFGVWLDCTRDLAGKTNIGVGWHNRPRVFDGREIVGNVLS